MCRDCMSVAQEWKLGVIIHLDKSTENEVATHAGHVIEMAIESNQRGAFWGMQCKETSGKALGKEGMTSQS